MRFDAARARVLQHAVSCTVGTSSGVSTLSGSFAASGVWDGVAAAVPYPSALLPLQVLVAAGVAGFWRGAWYVLDGTLFPDDLMASGAASLMLGTGGLTLNQHVVAPRLLRCVNQGKVLSPLVRFGTVYGMALSCVMIWRGAWVLCDAAYEKMTGWSALDKPVESGLLSHFAALFTLTGLGRATSVLGPPAFPCIFSDAPLWCKRPGKESAFVQQNAWLFRAATQQAKRL